MILWEKTLKRWSTLSTEEEFELRDDHPLNESECVAPSDYCYNIDCEEASYDIELYYTLSGLGEILDGGLWIK